MRKFTKAIHDATSELLAKFDDFYAIGLGMTYPNGADGTMGELAKLYPGRILDTPVSESAVTGLALGASLDGKKMLVHHGRVEFALFAADQIFTQAAKWNYMYGGDYAPSITFRIAIGHQWGNGPQHTGSFIPLFANTPGLKVVMPSTPNMAHGLLLAAVQDPNPVVFLEPRWLYNIQQEPDTSKSPSDFRSQVSRKGCHVTLVSYGEGVLECLKAAKQFSEIDIELEVIDLVSINPIHTDNVFESVNKTGNLIVVDPYGGPCSVGAEVIARIAQSDKIQLKNPPIQLSPPHVPVPTSPSLTDAYYLTQNDIIAAVNRITSSALPLQELTFEDLNLAPKSELGGNCEIQKF